MITEGSHLASFVPRLVATWPDDTDHIVVEGTLVFVDISGFTALSERLATLGPAGGEILTDTLGACFSDLLGVAYAGGGSLLKFGGDALLLLFDGPDHAARGCAAAIGMRARLREIGHITTPAGSVRLRMSVGIDGGRIHLFRAGSSHHELLIVGPTASGTVDMETTATAGEIVVSRTIADGLPRSSIGDARGNGWLLRGRAVHGAGFPPAPEISADPASWLPVALRDHLLAGGGGSEHRLVSVAFLRFEGTDDLCSASAHSTGAALNTVITAVQEAVEAHGVTFLGTDIDRDGGKIILVAGAPTTRGADEERILHALRRIMDASLPLPIRAGVNHGRVFAGEIGPSYRRTYTIMGDAVNLAARLMAAAKPGEVLATSSVLHLSETMFASTALPPFSVKGKQHPVEACVVGAPGGARSPGETGAPMIGRDAEFGVLLRSLEQARTGNGTMVSIEGPTGIGKSRLLAELCARADDVPVHLVRCDRYGSSTPFAAAREMFRSLFPGCDDRRSLEELLRRVAPDMMASASLIGDVAGIEMPEDERTAALEPRFRRQRTVRAVADLFIAAAQAPLLLACEDAERMDEASADVLAALATDATPRGWLICVTRGDEDGPPGATEHLVLHRLRDQDASALVDAAAPDLRLPPHERRALLDRAGGVPLFLLELTKLAARGHGGLPDSLEAVVAVQIDQLPPMERRLLRVAAVLGTDVDMDLLQEITGDDTLRTRVGALRGLLSPDRPGVLRFSHQLVRDVAYGGAPFAMRRQLHAVAADAIERRTGSDHPDVLSFHLFHGGRYDRCWVHARAAGMRAERAFANVDAVELYERALYSARRTPNVPSEEIVDIRERLGVTAMLGGLYAKADQAYRDALTAANGEAVTVARICVRRARIADRRGQTAGAIRWVQRALRTVEGVDGQEAATIRSQALVMKAYIHQQRGKPRQALEVCRAALELARASGNKRAVADALMLMDWAYVALGHPERAGHGEEALELLEELGDLAQSAVVLNNLGGVAYFQGRWEDAVAMYRRAQDAFERVGDTLDAGSARCNIAEILIDQGRLNEAEATLAEAIQLWRSYGFDLGIALATRYRGRIELRRGDPRAAIALFHEARAALFQAGQHSKVIEIDAWIAEALLQIGDVENARALIDDALRRQRSSGATEMMPMLLRLRAYAELGVDPAGALRDAEESIAVARARAASLDIALSLLARATVTKATGGALGDAEAREPVELFARLGVVSAPPPPVPERG